MIANSEFLEAVKTNIATYGVYLMAVSDAMECCSCGSEDCKSHDPASISYSRLDDGFVYTIGHRERGRPDMVVLCGPTPKDKEMSKEELVAEMNEVAGLLNYMVANWEEKPVLVNHSCGTHTGRVYVVSDEPELVAHAKEELTCQAGNYYETNDYELLVLMPMGRRCQCH